MTTPKDIEERQEKFVKKWTEYMVEKIGKCPLEFWYDCDDLFNSEAQKREKTVKESNNNMFPQQKHLEILKQMMTNAKESGKIQVAILPNLMGVPERWIATPSTNEEEGVNLTYEILPDPTNPDKQTEV